MVAKKQKSQLQTEKESEAIEQKSRLPIEERIEFAKRVNASFTFYKFFEFLKRIYKNLGTFKCIQNIKLYIYNFFYIF